MSILQHPGMNTLLPTASRLLGRTPLLWVSALVGLTTLIVVAHAYPPPVVVTAGVPEQTGSNPAGSVTTSLEEPLRLIAAARQTYQQVNDYSCTFLKRERIRGQLEPEAAVVMKVRREPFSINMRWLEPRSEAGQEVCYVAGRNRGQMRVHARGLAGVAGFVSLDPRDPRAMANTHHCITEAGIGNLIERYGTGWEAESRVNQTQVRLADYVFDNRPCTRVETIQLNPASGVSPFYRSVVYFDKTTHLPIRAENYDWPRHGGHPEGELAEVYSYTDLRLNVGVPDEVFNK